jgi:hypothetical protein
MEATLQLMHASMHSVKDKMKTFYPCLWNFLRAWCRSFGKYLFSFTVAASLFSFYSRGQECQIAEHPQCGSSLASQGQAYATRNRATFKCFTALMGMGNEEIWKTDSMYDRSGRKKWPGLAQDLTGSGGVVEPARRFSDEEYFY